MKFEKKYLILIAVTLICAFGTVDYVRAANLSSYKPLSEIEFLPKEEFEQKTKLIKEIPFDNFPAKFRCNIGGSGLTESGTGIFEKVQSLDDWMVL